MEKPQHAITCWLSDETIIVQYPDNQQVTIPATEPGRLVNILRTQVPRPVNRALGWRDHFIAKLGSDADKASYKQAKEKVAELRAKEEERLEREKRARMKRIAKRDAAKEADKILAIVGL